MKSFFHSESGFTLAEIMAGMLVMCVGVFALWQLAARAGLGFSRAGIEASGAARIEQVDRAIRKEVALVEVPFWAREEGFVAGRDSLAVPYYLGKKDSFLRFVSDSGALLVSGGKSGFSFKGVALDSVSFIRNGNGAPAGIEVGYSLGTRQARTKALFSSSSLQGEGHD